MDTSHACGEQGRPSYVGELGLARRLLDAGEKQHALHHCIGALALEPHRREWQPILRELLDGGDLVTKLEDDPFIGAQAAHALHLHDRGKLGDALDKIAGVASVVPRLGFQRWFATWLDEAVSQGVPFDPVAVLRVLMLGASFGIGRMRLLPAERAAAEDLVPVARVAVERVAGEPRVFLLASAILRRAGHCAEAAGVAEKGHGRVDPSMVATALGLALRGNREFDRAATVFEQAHQESGDLIYLQEKYRVLADAGRWEDALAVADHVYRHKEPDDENRAEHDCLRRAVAARAPAPDEPPLDLVRRRSLGHGYLFPMQDATANALRNVAADPGVRSKGPTEAGESLRAGSVTMGVSGNEGASNRLTQAVMFAGVADPRQASYTIDGSSSRAIVDAADQYTPWRHDEEITVQALPAPPDAVADWIERLALEEPDGSAPERLFEATGDFLDMWRASAPTAVPPATARDWVAATVHPRMPVFRVCMGPDWVYRWQVAALIGLARSEPRWADSTKRDALLSLLRGIIDWPLAAAIRVAAELALEDPDATAELRQALIEIVPSLRGEPNGAIAQTLLISLEALPFVEKECLDQLRAQIERGDSSEPEPPPQGRRPWWKFWKR